MSTFTARTFTNVFTDARAAGLLNDIGSDIFTDAVLLPHGAFTHLEIQEEFAASGIPMVETVSDTFSYTANATSISVPGGITDLREPMELWEKSTSDSVWLRMYRKGQIPPPPVSYQARLVHWEWLNGAIRVEPCSENRDVFVRYRRQLPYPAASDTIGFDGIYLALVAGTAMHAAIERPQLVQKASVMYARAIDRAIRIASRDRQMITYRRKPWNHRPRVGIIQEPWTS